MRQDQLAVAEVVDVAPGARHGKDVVVDDDDPRPLGPPAQLGVDPPVMLAPDLALVEVGLGGVDSDDLGEARDRAEEGLIYALNAALVASGTSMDEPEDVGAALADARATLSLGLETLSGGAPDRAAAALAERPIREIFQAGLVDPYRLQSRARRIASRLKSSASWKIRAPRAPAARARRRSRKPRARY